MNPTKQRLLHESLALLLERGYHDLGIQALLDRTGVPKGSFYHHFTSKEEMALEAIDEYMSRVHGLLEVALASDGRAPLQRVHSFFERLRELYASQGFLGSLLGALGQEVSGVKEDFRRKMAESVSSIVDRLAVCVEEARQRGDLPAGWDSERYADLLVNAWEGAALRSRLLRGPAPLDAFLDFYFPDPVDG